MRVKERVARWESRDQTQVLPPDQERLHCNLDEGESTARLLVLGAPDGPTRGAYIAALVIFGVISWYHLAETEKELVRAAYRRRR